MTHPPADSRLMIVDDDPGTIRLLIQILKDLGRIDFATSGAEALDLARSTRHDLILLDIEMPDMDGFDVCRILKADPGMADVPILFVTGHDDGEREARAIEMGGADFITKPLNPTVVRARVTCQLALKHRHDALRHSNAELEQFAGILAHDLRAPLQMVTLYLGLVEQRLGPHLDDDARRCLDLAGGGALRMGRMLGDLLDYSMLGRPEAVPEPVCLGEAVADARSHLDMAVHDSGAEVRVAKDLPTVSGYRSDLVRLFQNLIGNAVKYRAPDRAPVVEVGAEAAGHEWRVWVRDNGIGIAAADRDRAFMIFQRLGRSDDREGTGIGLAVCKKIVERLGGRIWIESEPGEGSCFFVALPKDTTRP